MQVQRGKKVINSLWPIYSDRCTEDWCLIPIYTTGPWPSLWYSNSIMLGRNYIVWLYAWLQQALLIQPAEDSCLLGAPARAPGLGHPTGTPQTWLPRSACLSEQLWCLAVASPWAADPATEGRGHTEKTESVVFWWGRSQLAARSVLLVFLHKAREWVPDPDALWRSCR